MDSINKKEIGTTIPLYDEVKKTIYLQFNELSNSFASLIGSTNKTEYNLSLWDFKIRYIKFFIQINHIDKLRKIHKNKYLFLINCYSRQKKFTLKDCTKIINYSRELIENLGIMKIEGKIKDNWAI